MPPTTLPVGSFVRIEKPDLQLIVDRLRQLEYRTVGPTVTDGAVVYDDIESIDQLPIGKVDWQDGGTYRLQDSGMGGFFDYVVGPHSLKRYLFPPRETLMHADRQDGSWQFQAPQPRGTPLAVIGPRACDLAALKIQDTIFLEGPYVDPAYRARREALFIAAVNCRRAAATCFCHSMRTGPQVTGGSDLTLTELDGRFIIEVGTECGGEVIAAAGWTPCSMAEIEAAKEVSDRLVASMRKRASGSSPGDEPRERYLDTTDLRDVLLTNLEHARWNQVGERCLACANCTMVCPTCFCSSVHDIADLSGDHVDRERRWASCFTAEHSYMNSGTVRKSIPSRYRQWLTHKLASWIDQYGVSGCTGCGRCITWCPVGIDLTEEVAAIRGA